MRIYKYILYFLSFNFILSLLCAQSKTLGIHQDPGDDIIRVVNISEKFAIEVEINPDNYILGPSDKLGLNIIGSENKTFIVTISPTGEILIPQVGTIHISGMSVNDAKLEINNFIKYKAFSNARLEMVVLNIRKFKIQTIGAFNAPGFVTISSIDRLSDVVKKVGGLHKYANQDSIIIKGIHKNNIISIREFNKTGNLDSNPMLKEGDVVFVPYKQQYKEIINQYITAKNTPIIVTGFVLSPKSHNYYPGYTVIEYIGFSGGVLDMGSLKKVEIYRDGKVFYPKITDVIIPGDQIYVPANLKYRFLGNVSILQTLTAIMSLYLTFQAATSN